MKLADRIFRRSRGNGKDQYYITSPFGWRKDPISGEYKGHKGCDYGTHGNKWAQYALEDGTVESYYKDYYGALCVRVAYPRLGIRCTHAHLDKVFVKTGQKVNKDTVLGNTGTTGYSTGVHLHLGVQKIGSSTWIDPETIDYKEEVKPAPTPTPETKDLKFKVGDKVYIEGALYVSSDAKAPSNIIAKRKTEITRVNPGSAHPYNTTGDLGWMDESSITKYTEPAPKPSKEICKGDSVRIINKGNGSSDGDAGTAYGIGWVRKVLAVHSGKPYPYQVGNNSGTTGFYKANALEKI